MRKGTLEKLGADSFPDKCNTCAFEISYDRSKEEIDQLFDALSKLNKYKLSIYPHRVMEIGNVKKTYHGRFCSLGKNKIWGPHKKHKNCRDRHIKLPTSEMSISDYFSIHQSKISRSVSTKLSLFTIVIGLFALILSIIYVYVLFCR